jgi:TPR repeat protein
MTSLAKKNILQNRRQLRGAHAAIAHRSYAGVTAFKEEEWPPIGLLRRDRPALKEAYIYWLKASREGDIEALYKSGVMLRDGRGVRKNEAAALRCWKRASTSGHQGARDATAALIQKQQQDLMSRGGMPPPQETRDHNHHHHHHQDIQPDAPCPCGAPMTYQQCCARCSECRAAHAKRRSMEEVKKRMSVDKLNAKLASLEEHWGINGRRDVR